jgi:4-diphosphocytidyl-2-C-methyl-D-erythritol kinase
VVLFPNCKINLGLNIIRKREDGFHDIESVFYPLPLCDAIEISKLAPADFITKDVEQPDIYFSTSGIKIEGSEEDNLCIKAYNLLKNDFPELPQVKMHLLKAIPIGAGLGGGSSDGAFTLRLLNELFNLKVERDKLVEYALQLGSDCPFFIINKPCFAKGRGEILEEIDLDLNDYHFIIVNPGIHINTGWAFSKLSSIKSENSIRSTIKKPVHDWKDELKNDFEDIAMEAHPLIREIKEKLYQHGALFASMTGSGSTVFGLFDEPLSSSEFPPGCKVYYL